MNFFVLRCFFAFSVRSTSLDQLNSTTTLNQALSYGSEKNIRCQKKFCMECQSTPRFLAAIEFFLQRTGGLGGDKPTSAAKATA